jgi:hypothetical protein
MWYKLTEFTLSLPLCIGFLTTSVSTLMALTLVLEALTAWSWWSSALGPGYVIHAREHFMVNVVCSKRVTSQTVSFPVPPLIKPASQPTPPALSARLSRVVCCSSASLVLGNTQPTTCALKRTSDSLVVNLCIFSASLSHPHAGDSIYATIPYSLLPSLEWQTLFALPRRPPVGPRSEKNKNGCSHRPNFGLN